MLADIYITLHKPLASILCLSGIAGHCFAITILSKMVNPTNLLLLSMSGSQLILCVNFLYSTVFKYATEHACLSFMFSYFWTLTLLMSATLSILVHLSGVFHVVALSIIRYLSLRQLSSMNSNSVWFDMRKCIKTLVIIYVSVVVICIPLFFHSEISQSDSPDDDCVRRYPKLANTTSYHLSYSSNEQLQQINYWLFGSICKLMPSFFMLMMTFLILNQLKSIRQMSARFSNENKDKQHHRTTKIILMVMVMFICVEAPQGIMALLHVRDEVLLDFFDMATLLNSCLIFGLFLAMNSRLREACINNLDRFRPSCCALRYAPPIDSNKFF
jgi:hypothetical protein